MQMGPDDTAPPPGEGRDAGWVGRLAWIALYSATLLVALRFGGRTYPGWYFPNSAVLNWLLNEVGLFTVIGYDLVLAGAIAATMRVLLGRNAPRALRHLQWLFFALAILIVAYGAAWAIVMHRLPWQADGHGRYPPLASLSP